MQKEIIAHKYDDGSIQLLEDHLKNVANLSIQFAKNCNLNEEHMKQIALMHDYGKCSLEFQEYILGNSKNRVSHSNIGGKKLFDAGDLIGSFCVFGHHTGLPDMGTKQDESTTLLGRYNFTQKEHLNFLLKTPENLRFLPERNYSEAKKYPFFDRMLEIRMYLSCLVDADWQDSAEIVRKEEYDSWDTIYQRFHNNIKEKFASADNTEINQWRSEIFKECQEKGKNGTDKIVSLSAPTGSGKTFSSIAFALERVKRGDANRIIYCIPYTSIIEQNAEEYKKVVGKQNVIEHHSLAEFKKEEHTVDEENYFSWKVENWDAPIILTTNVQFFESLLSARGRRVRKLHNIANSVIIFDEAQMLPRDFLTCCKELMKILVEQYNCTIVLCTATQPSLNIGEMNHELLNNPELMYERFKRVHAENIDGSINQDRLVSLLKEDIQNGNSVLCIVNKKKIAQDIYRKISEDKSILSYHLSLNMCSLHRMEVLKKVKSALELGKPVCLISTSLVEAGVNLSFDIGYRELTGADRLVQAAGRVNRHAIKKDGTLKVFRLEGERYDYPEHYVADRLLRSDIDIFSQEAITRYFSGLNAFSNPADFDKYNIMAYAKTLSFIETENHARIIEDNQIPILIPYNEEAKKLINKLMYGGISRESWKELRKYTVSVYQKILNEFNKLGAFDVTEDGIYILKSLDGFYDNDCGILNTFEPNGLFI